MTSVQPIVRRVLYFSSSRKLADSFLDALTGAAEYTVRRERGRAAVTCGATAFELELHHDVRSAHEALHRGYFNLVLLDLREPVHGPGKAAREYERGLALLEAMDGEPDIERRYAFHRIVALVASADPEEVDDRIAALGARGVGRVLRDLSSCYLNPACDRLPKRQEFARRVIGELERILANRRPGKLALCASGGGITGLYFELGVLKCLEDCCSPGALNAFDLYFGISAGSVAVGMLANGYAVGEFMAAISGEPGGRIPQVDLNLLDTSHLDVRGLTAPLRQLFTIAGHGAAELLRGRLPFSLESLVFEYGDLIHPPFCTDGFEDLIRRSFSRPGCTNDFRELPRRLFVGATDQDLKEHVLFGEAPHERVPISRAIQASMSLNPVFSSTEIDGRYYEDGAVTRTSNFGDAIRKGANLIFALDPLVPYVSKRPGFARGRGVFYNADQDIRTVSYTRYENTRNSVLRSHPEVSLYTFLPANQLRRTLSVNPMDHRLYLEIWRGAYISTLRRIHTLGYRMRGDLAAHGIGFDTSAADAVAERLQATRKPKLADFFPEGRVEVRIPAPLAPLRPVRRSSRRAALAGSAA